MRARIVTLAARAALALTLAPVAAPAQAPPAPTPLPTEGPPATPAELNRELAGLKEQESVLQAQIRQYEKDRVEAAALNRARIGMGVVLAQEAILTLRLGAGQPAAFDEASDLIRRAESYSVAVDTSTLTVDDSRVFSDLQAVCRRALAQQVSYLRDLMMRRPAAPASPQRVVYVPVAAPAPPPRPAPVYAPAAPAVRYVPVPPARPRCVLFRRPFGR